MLYVHLLITFRWRKHNRDSYKRIKYLDLYQKSLINEWLEQLMCKCGCCCYPNVVANFLSHLGAKNQAYSCGCAQLRSDESKEVFQVRSSVWQNEDAVKKKKK